MRNNIRATIFCLVAMSGISSAGEKQLLSLRNFCDTELKSSGIELPVAMTVHIKAVGGGGDYGWTYKSNEMFAYGWIIDADTRKMVWKMDVNNTSRAKPNKEFDGTITLNPGSYEVYFTVPTFSYHTTFTHINVNIDHKEQPLFGSHSSHRNNFLEFFKNWWSDDIERDWEKRCDKWGMELFVDDAGAKSIRTFPPPKPLPNTVLRAAPLGDGELVRTGFVVTETTPVHIYAIGEATNQYEMADYTWIVNTEDRSRVWEMDYRKCQPAGGAEKNITCAEDLTLPKGTYVMYCVTDDSHSSADWNAAPPYDPLNWGATISVVNGRDGKNIKPFQYVEDRNVIVAITKVGNDERRSTGFTLKQDARVRIYAFGERANSRRSMADYGAIIDAKTRNKVWTMDVDKSLYAGGTSKNRYVDEIITLPRGNYIVTYNTDDSHAYGDWNAQPPFDQEHYGITVMGAGETFNSGIVSKYVEQGDKNIIAQLVRMGDNENAEKGFTIERTTRVRVYAIGEGEKRQMFDYGWIEDAKTGAKVWEMTYPMTFHAGGGRKNRMVNTTIVLDKGEYKLRYRSDDSHSYNNWNVDPPDDREFWGITLFRDDLPEPETPQPPLPPKKPE